MPPTYEPLPKLSVSRRLALLDGIQTMLDFWKKSENNTRFSIIVLGICLIVLVALVTRL